MFFPINNPSAISDLFDGLDFIIEKCYFNEKRSNIDISKLLSLEFPNVDLNEIIIKYDQMGEIGVLKLDPSNTTVAFRSRVGELILSQTSKLKTIVNKIDVIEGTERIYPIEHLAGESNTQSWHQEYGILINFDIKTTYFNPRLAEEHNRVAKLIVSGEKVLDLFCGVGPFALYCANRIACKVVAVDINPDAILALKKSITHNKLQGNINAIIGDSLSIFQSKNYFDRIIMNLPQNSADFLPYATRLLKKGGIITFYQFIPKSRNPEKDIRRMVSEKIKGVKSYKVLYVKVGREISPSKVQMNVDIQID